jgi:uncharacterized protein YdeI (BOF family)
MKIMAIVIFVTLTLSLPLCGCGPKTGLYGQAITETETIQIGDILASADRFAEKTVRIEGKIIEECPAGGWFMLEDSTGVILVNLHPSYFAIPQAVGHRAIAQGVVQKEGTRIEVIGKGVQLR